MKVDRLDVSVYTIPTEEPESDGTFTWTQTTVVVAEPHAGGQARLGFSYASGACATLIAELLAEVVVGADPMDVPGVWAHGDRIPRVKMKVATAWGTRPRRDLERVARIRQALGDGVEPYVDANGGYGRKQAVRLGRAFAEEG